MNRREMITGLGAVVVGGAAARSTSEPAKFTNHHRSKAGDPGTWGSRVWLDGEEITSNCYSVDTELGVVEVYEREPIFHRVRRFGNVKVEIGGEGGKVYPS